MDYKTNKKGADNGELVMVYRCALLADVQNIEKHSDHTNLNDEHDDEANHGGEQLEKSSNVFLSLPLKHLRTFCKVDPS